MKRGTQIAYIPDHANGNILHPDVEFGFVTGKMDDCHFCRYWSKINPGYVRTQSNSELTLTRNLMKHKSVSQKIITMTLKDLGYSTHQKERIK